MRSIYYSKMLIVKSSFFRLFSLLFFKYFGRKEKKLRWMYYWECRRHFQPRLNSSRLSDFIALIVCKCSWINDQFSQHVFPPPPSNFYLKSHIWFVSRNIFRQFKFFKLLMQTIEWWIFVVIFNWRKGWERRGEQESEEKRSKFSIRCISRILHFFFSFFRSFSR